VSVGAVIGQIPFAFGLQFAIILNGWSIHKSNHLGKIKECGGHGVETNIYGTISTFDFTDMTDAVLIAHQMGVRLEVKSSGPRMLKIMAHVRVSSDDKELGSPHRHPTIDGLIERATKFRLEESK